MSTKSTIQMPESITLPDIPAIFANSNNAVILTTDGELLTLSHNKAASLIKNTSVMVCHAPYTKSRLGFEDFYSFDVLELFAFVHPTRFCVPTPVGLCQALNCDSPNDFEDYPFALMDITRTLLMDLQNDSYKDKADPIKIANIMGLKGKGWPWVHFIYDALGQSYNTAEETPTSSGALNVWKHLPEWTEEAPTPPTAHEGVSESEAIEKLSELLCSNDKISEIRPQQKSYASNIARMFDPMQEDKSPHIVLAEAGTGVGKTLGYLAPASVWAEKNEGSVWISTYTKNLQRQIDSELDRLYPHPDVKNAYVSLRKGRENYLCILNLEEISSSAATSYNPRYAVAAGIMARWVVATKDGDLSGADFPGWLSGLLGFANTYGLADRRGECIYSSCNHYNRCFIEHSVRKAKKSRIVIANHALVMIQSAISSSSDEMPTRYIFDEGHHLFNAADSAFSSHLTARESADLRRWILGNEDIKKGRSRGIKRRIEDIIEGDKTATKYMEEIIRNARCLCAKGWSHRLKNKEPQGPTEKFLMEVYRIVYARAKDIDTPYSIETSLFPLDNDIIATGIKLSNALSNLLAPLDLLAKHLHQRLVKDQGEMDSNTRKRIDAITTSIEKRGCLTVKNWISMLKNLEDTSQTISKEGFVDWLEVKRIEGKSIDVGLHRHYIDPMKPFAFAIIPHLHGMAITSATLKDSSDNEKTDIKGAYTRTGAYYLSAEPALSSFPSPFDYAANTKIIIIDDVNKNDLGQVSSAYQALFKASGGGALGLFTAIQRLQAVYDKIALPLEQSGITLYGQHIEKMDTGTLIDIFRDDKNSCLLGTDAVRDGVDIPGNSLRLLVFDRVPWPRPTLLHKARRNEFGGRNYDEMITRLKLKQAFGRLIRRADDKGIFIMLDSGFPSRLHGAFPKDTQIIKTGLKDAVSTIIRFWK